MVRSRWWLALAGAGVLVASAAFLESFNVVAHGVHTPAVAIRGDLGVGTPSTKAALIAREHARLLQARFHRTPKENPKTARAAIPASPAPKRTAGIIDMQQGPFSPMVFQSRNFWMGPLSGQTWVLVYAGQLQRPTPQGALYVEREGRAANGQFTFTPMGYFRAPGGSSAALKVVAWHGVMVSLDTTLGQALQFDVATDTYVP